MAKLSGGRQLADLNRQDSGSGSLTARIIDAVNHLAKQVGVDPVGQAQEPPKPSGVNVTVTGEMAHVRILDNNPTNRARNYFSEVYSDPQHTQLLHAQDHGTSRDAVIPLPTNTSAGVMKDYYLSVYSQTPGSPPSARVPYSTYITMDGATNGDMPQSAGSGTGSANGSQVGQGFGAFPTRVATGVKRQGNDR